MSRPRSARRWDTHTTRRASGSGEPEPFVSPDGFHVFLQTLAVLSIIVTSEKTERNDSQPRAHQDCNMSFEAVRGIFARVRELMLFTGVPHTRVSDTQEAIPGLPDHLVVARSQI